MKQITFQDFFTLGGIIILSYLLKYIYGVIYHAYFGTLSKVPGPKLFFLTRHLMSIKLLLGRRWKWIQDEIVPTYGPIVRLGPKVVMIADKDAIREIIAADFPKSHSYEKIRADAKFDTLFSAVNKSVHKQRRKMFSPAFANKFLKSLEPLMSSCVKELVYKVNESVEPFSDGVVLNVVNLVQSCIVDILGETNFGGRFNSVKTLNHPLPRKVYEEVSKRAIRSMFPLFKSFLELDPFLWNFSNDLIEKRKQSGKIGVDLLQVTLDAVKSVNNDQVTNYEIFEQILEFLIAGTDTVSFTSSMAIILLAKNPSKLKALQQELDNAFGDNGELPEHDQLKSLPYLNGVINETMRLWPVVLDAGIGRFSVKDTVIKGYMIPARTNLLLNFYWLHHDPKYWGENAEEFVPERWLDIDSLPKNVFFPFSSGPRNCIGKNFAMMEMRLIIASLLSRFDVKDISTQKFDVLCYIVPSFNDMKYNLVFNKRKIGISRD